MFASFHCKPDLRLYAGKALQGTTPKVGWRMDAFDERTNED
jgi:hypothetical protein